MKILSIATASLSLLASSLGHAQGNASSPSTVTSADVRSVAPAMDKYATVVLEGEIWRRPDLSARDRSIVTVAAMIARNQVIEMPAQINRALDNGVKPSELSELITHLAFYSGWPNALQAVAITRPIYAKRRIGIDQLPAVSPQLLPIDVASEAQRATSVEENFGSVSRGVVKYTGEVLFQDLWLRPALAPRDRSLVTISALIATGQVAQLGAHLNRAMDNGLTKPQASEVLTHLAFYGGWPNVFTAMPIVKTVFEKRPG
ncbi:carboxymuconolactone decarboxylase family protein [Variovorax rhizosphaerae]|uniref:Carboxymuconolactone decarboxylase family protein n=1 Tax=Variovorax rhizosphaerae TaxID=1836200 RepID=A0ABU8WUY0_9BURK